MKDITSTPADFDADHGIEEAPALDSFGLSDMLSGDMTEDLDGSNADGIQNRDFRALAARDDYDAADDDDGMFDVLSLYDRRDDSVDGDARSFTLAGLSSWLTQYETAYPDALPIVDIGWFPPMAFVADDIDQSEFAELIPTDPRFGQQWHLNNTGIGIDLNITDVWDDYTGDGIRVVVIDTGTDRSHEDLAANINFALDWDYLQNDAVAEPVGTAVSQHHGTAVTGIIGQVNNSVGGVGVAYDSELIIFRGYGIDAAFGDEVWLDAAGLGDTVGNPNGNSIDGDVVNMSAGYGDDVFIWTQFLQDAVDAMETAAEDGRGGLGTIMVKSAGNSRDAANSTLREESTAELYDTTRHTINVAAIERTGDVTSYSSPGANLLTSAFAPDDFQTGFSVADRSGTDGYNSASGAAGNYTTTFNGTSAAAPQVSGVVALMLEANPNLGWRDVQKILALASRNVGSDVGATATGSEQATDGSASWQWNAAGAGSSNLHWNGGGLHFSNDYGYGAIDALAAVRLAETWELTGTSGTGGTEVTESRDMDGTFVTTNYSLGFVSHTATFSSNIIVQHISVNIDFDIDDLADMEVFIISPNGTRVQLINDTGDSQAFDTSINANNRGWNFGSTAFLGEEGNGTWTVQIRNDDGSAAGTFSTSDVDLTIYGDTETADDLFVYTDAFSDYDGVAGHLTSASGSGGVNTMNAAAVTSNTLINLLAGTGTIDGVATTNSFIDRVFTGDGNDTVIGDGISEFIDTGRGNDSVEGGAGAETINGGTGNDSLDGGAGDDTINGGDGNDTITGGLGNDIMNGGNGNDVFDFEAGVHSSDTINGGAGTDKILLSGLGTFDFNGADLSISSIEEIEFNADVNGTKIANFTIQEFDNTVEVPANLLIDSSGGNIDILNFFATGVLFSTIDWSGWNFQNWDDTLDELNITLGGAISNFTSTQERDNITGSANAETINSGLDNDTVNAGAGDDTVDGGSGNDSLDGGTGNDSVIGGTGNDTINTGSDGQDTLEGGSGNDRLIKGGFLTFGADDSFDGGTGNDTIVSTVDWANGVLFDLAAGNISLLGDVRDTLTSIENAEVGGSADVIGTSGANLIIATGVGSFDNNDLDGGSGDDTINAGAGNDSIRGGAGNDSLLGGDGNDTIEGQGGSDTIDAGEGDDLIQISPGWSGGDVNDGGAGNDTFRLNFGATSGYTINLDTGSFNGGGDSTSTLINIENLIVGNGADNLTGSGFANRIEALGGNDTVLGLAGDDTLLGGDGNDSLVGGQGQNSIEGGAGDDTLDGSGFSADSVFGGDGNDLVILGSGSGDEISGGAGIDTLDYSGASAPGTTYFYDMGAGRGVGLIALAGPFFTTFIDAFENLITISGSDNVVVGNSLANAITSSTGDDSIDGGAGNDTILGGDGSDTLEGGSGADSLNGGDGDDLIVQFNGWSGGDTYNGGAGTDTFDWSGTSAFAVTANLTTGAWIGGGGNLTMISIENMIDNAGDGTLIGSFDANRIEGRAGNDSILGEGGSDTLLGGSGNDTLDGGFGIDDIFGDDGDDLMILANGAGSDNFNGGAGNDTVDFTGITLNTFADLTAGFWNFVGFIPNYDLIDVENFIFGDGNDSLEGSIDANFIDGGAGNDRLRSFGGNDSVLGGLGDDTVNGGAGNDTLEGGAGNDTVYGQDGDDIMFGDDGDDLLIGNAGNDSIQGGDGANDMRGREGDDIITGGFDGDLAFGGDGNDTIDGLEGNDSLQGNGGNDSLLGFSGDDRLFGQLGADTLLGEDGEDELFGGDGNDDIFGGNDNDELFGGTGSDSLDGGEGNDLLRGNQQNDTLSGGFGQDTLFGDDGFDVLFGGNGNDQLQGGNGNDTLTGGNGNDVLFGGFGNDELIGSFGQDTLRGNAGADTFLFETAADSGPGVSDLIDGIDGVGVFGGDRIDVSNIDADTSTGFDDAFIFLGNVSSAVALGFGAGALWVENFGAQTRLFGLVDNDIVIDFEVRINDAGTLASDYTASDFVL
ncbi:MAG: S8 family serine peptidase [Pseudomonadota bacterium]